ncbi:hypothetical protein DSO57_1002589 [Entomophthora muscae]|uniref:Uncharacterized protein n=1 Tax=Entomophthora muscae TaxID=34485 RepID=A0ACC2U6J7_9FUNG|nr:hypothetical protein DSO57_1002589 [Entomophthora muscae]
MSRIGGQQHALAFSRTTPGDTDGGYFEELLQLNTSKKRFWSSLVPPWSTTSLAFWFNSHTKALCQFKITYPFVTALEGVQLFTLLPYVIKVAPAFFFVWSHFLDIDNFEFGDPNTPLGLSKLACGCVAG